MENPHTHTQKKEVFNDIYEPDVVMAGGIWGTGRGENLSP